MVSGLKEAPVPAAPSISRRNQSLERVLPMTPIIKALDGAEVRDEECKNAPKHTALISSLLTFCFVTSSPPFAYKLDSLQLPDER